MNRILFALLASTLSLGVSANSKKQDLQGQLNEERQQIVSDDMREQARIISSSRSDLKTKEDLANREVSYYKASTEQAKAMLQWKREQFVAENVPIEYVIAGDKAVTQFVIDNFINTSSAKSGEAKVLWASDDSALVSLEAPVLEKTIVNPVIVEQAAPVQTVQEQPTDIMTEEEKRKIAESLGALGLTVNQAGAIAENKPEPIEETPSQNKNVLIHKIDVQRVVIMGKIQSLDAMLHINVIDGFKKRDINLPVANMSPNTRFMIDSTPFELTRLSDAEVVFTNLDTNISFKEIVR